MYSHFSATAPYGFGNDGLLDIRLTYSNDIMENISYAQADNARSPFVSLGINTCGSLKHSPDVKGGWCNVTSGILANTSFDTSAMYAASGFIFSPDGEEVFMYSSGQPFTHGGDGAKKTSAYG